MLVGFGALAAGVLIGRYYVPDDRQLRRTARHSKAYMRALSHLIARDHDTVVSELRNVVEENVDDVEPYFALGAMFRSRGEHERAIRVHQALALRERDKRKLKQRAMYELGLDFRAAGMPRRATKAMEQVLLEEPSHEGALRVLAALYEEQARFNEAATLQHRLGRKREEDTSAREHHLLVAAAQSALARDDLDSAKQQLKSAQKLDESAHFFAAAAELAAARGNHRGAKERLKQALIADPALVPHLLPGLIAAEEGIEKSANPGRTRDELDEEERRSKPMAAVDPALVASLEADQKQLAPGDTALATVSGSHQVAGVTSTSVRIATPPQGVALVPDAKPIASVSDRVLALLAEVEAETGPRLELALIRAQLAPPSEANGQLALATELTTRFPDAIAARVATARLAIAGGDQAAIKTALEVFVSEQGALAWAMRGRWQCENCGHRPGPFSWRCGSCRRWASLRMETGVEPPPVPSRERRAAPRTPRTEGLLGASPDESLPTATLDSGLTDEELSRAGVRRSLLGKVGGWFSGVWRRDRSRA
jgi:lipopolysaccharide biosynthesis regulator YciM